jgi:3-hydroxyisobutyrate dehydrogenase
MTQVGFVGVGRMGANMALRLHEQGYRVTAVHDRNPEIAKAVAHDMGCEAASTPARVAELSECVITVVSDDVSMRHIYASESSSSLLAFAQGRLFINCATVTPSVHVDVEQVVEEHGGASLEACMASSITQARQGTLYLMCGGKPGAFERAQPLLQTLGSTVRYIGKAGEAAKVKALVNMVMNCNTAALAEGLGLGEALGLNLHVLREVFGQTGAASRVLETDGEDMQARAHECYFSSAHAAKDSGIALALARSAGLTLPLAQATYEQYTRLVALGRGDLDKSAIAELTFRGRDR